MSEQIIEELKKAILEYDSVTAARCAKKVVEERIDPVKALDAMVDAVRSVGDAFGKRELWLPELVGAADAMQSALPIIEEEIAKGGATRQSLGTIVIGTVQGDIHSIGKNLVATFLLAHGFEVRDLGVDIEARQFVEAVGKWHAKVLAMSALMTTTAPEQKKVIQMLTSERLRDRVKVMVGGAAITQEFAREIGADGYESTAVQAAPLARSLVGK